MILINYQIIFLNLKNILFCYSVACLLFELRDSLWATVRYLVENQDDSFDLQSKEKDIVSDYRDEMLQVLDEILSVSAKNDQKPETNCKKPKIDPFNIEVLP